ncbi:AmmeMemoRadiSam system radical SAM enzyme [Desulforamulus hydrothermalis]|uniref:Radical SAM core domain-containing protein n=1 Tax=Desulforamulus hydrothermalis Lam5 = DSM 18033 TaxID=1121428 RepID=K8E8J2_9FIRM|nr:AmmeMemoRadiSam system radical SAM enzyme [Desulforamulus hydrothermalis]CCO07838.1 conserved hypothetical protein [Desulforamulus hydrothermalis Lam5 = DSM 18033]SHH27389.1 pyruvate formate lyase activating enzyme [Desulforamulus hydrothermalis Lam5 = DSM 18033]
MQEAMYWQQLDDNVVFCRLCPKGCRIREGHRGYCRVRENRHGSLYTLNYGRVAAYAMDPMEKKPLYHFYPGSLIFSLGTVGCNLRCGFCQNWQIAQGDPPTCQLTPRQAVELALQQKQRGLPCVGIAYTYSEPLMWYEYVYDTARLAKQAGLQNVLVTNGYVRQEPLKQLLPCIDAMNIDVKGFTEEYYHRSCRGQLAPVLETVATARQYCHVEITTLLVPGLNDNEADLQRLVDWLADLDPDIPLHFSRYFPNYQFDLPPTPPATMRRAYELARTRLNYVFLGNLGEAQYQHTYCPRCRNLLVQRNGYQTNKVGLAGQACRQCGEPIKIIC